MAWTKVEPFTGTVHHGCLNCGGTHIAAPMDMVIGVGFGSAYALKDDQIVYDEMEAMRNGADFDDLATVQQIEEMAAADPDHDWRIVLHGPLRGATYQRHDAGHWVLIESNQGFA